MVEAYVLWTGVWTRDDDASDLEATVYRHASDEQTISFPHNAAPDTVAEHVAAIVSKLGEPSPQVEEEIRRFERLQVLPKQPWAHLHEGDTDQEFGYTVGDIIFKHPKFWVYLIAESHDINWTASADYGAFPSDFGAVLNRVAMLQSEPIGQLTPTVRVSFRKLVGEGVARLLDDRKTEYAGQVLDKAEAFLKARNAEAARKFYLRAAFGMMVPALAVAFFAWWARAQINGWVSPRCADFAVLALLGSIGAFLSVFYRLTTVSLDACAGKKLLALEGRLRIAVGVLAGLLVAWASRSGLIGFLPTDGSIIPIAFIAALAGASERLVPTLITTVESKTTIKT